MPYAARLGRSRRVARARPAIPRPIPPGSKGPSAWPAPRMLWRPRPAVASPGQAMPPQRASPVAAPPPAWRLSPCASAVSR